MTRGPWVISKTSKPFGNDAQMFDSSFGWRFINPQMQKLYGTDAMGITAENLATMYGISREDQDLFAYNSQQKAFIAKQNSVLADEIMKIEMTDRKGNITIFDKDELSLTLQQQRYFNWIKSNKSYPFDEHVDMVLVKCAYFGV